jgi:hypothetical protein
MIVLMTAALVLIAGGLFFANQKETDTILVTFPNGKQIATEVANTPEKLLFGLAFREGLPPDGGMLYIFETSDRHRLWTKAYRIPVDMIWVDERHRVVHVVENAPPCAQDPCPLFGPPPEAARYIIQTAAGFIKHEQVLPGAELKFTLQL